MTPEKIPNSRKYFSTEFSPQENSGAVSFVREHYLSFQKSAKDLHAEDYPKSEAHQNFSSAVRWG